MRIAIIENTIVTNVVIGEIDKVSQIFNQCVEETELTNTAWIGARYNGKKFEAVKVYDSWTWNRETFEYDPPIEKPEGDYYWSEAEGNWIEMPEPELSS